jgi:DNA mismatch endonuclease (patch repair protein)
MADIFTKEKRSEVMSKVKGKNTSIERQVFRYLRKHGVYFQKHYRRAPGHPDVALPRKRRAVFIDGDFWHGWRYASLKDRLPNAFWREKIERNVARDRRNRRELRAAGWQVLRVWEHELRRKKDRERALEKIRRFLVAGVPGAVPVPGTPEDVRAI